MSASSLVLPARAAVLDVGHRCNNRCAFCAVADTRDRVAPEAALAARIDEAAALGCSLVVLTGGEATIRPDLLRLASRVAAQGMGLGLVTNGRMLSVPGLLERLLRRRLVWAQVSVHGPPAVHDALVGDAAFEQSMGGARAAAARGVAVGVRCVVTRSNAEHLGALAALIGALPGVGLTFGPAEPHGDGARPGVALPLEDAAAAIAQALDAAPWAAHAGVPLCLVPGHEGRGTDARARGVAFVAPPGGPLRALPDARVQPAPCAACALRGRCPGLHPGDLAARLRPRPGLRSNSYTLTPRAELPWPDGAPCPALGRPLDPLRQALLRGGGRLVVHETRTRDFAPDELRAVVERWGQLYLDASAKDAPDDFAADLRKLVRDPACASCPSPACPGALVPTDGDPFGADDAVVLGLVAGLRGDVLDVGCGDGRYGEALAPRVASGVVRYRGFDPDAERIEGLRARWPWATLEVGTAEEAPLEPESLDHALVLRSWNHLLDPGGVAARLVRALRPGGTLLVVDNVTFGLLRTAAQATRAEAGPAAFEHWRNDDAARAAGRLAGLPLREILRREVGPPTSNQWVLRYERTGGDA